MTGEMLDAQTAGQQVRDALRSVQVPHFERALIDLGLLAAVHIDDGRVHLRLRLPTYVSAATFGPQVVADAKAAVAALPWVTSVEACLDEDVASSP